MYYTYNDKRTDRERELEYELEQERERRERERERQEQERESRRREQQERWAQSEREADDWPEAFQKQARLCWREYNAFPEQKEEVTGDSFDGYFRRMAQANEKALEIWREVAASKQAQLDELQKQIEAVWESVRNETADKLEAADEATEYKSTAQEIRNDNLGNYLDW